MKIFFVTGDRAGEELNFDGAIVTLGREEDNLLQLLADGVSRHHGRIYWNDAGYWQLADLGSTNGIKLNYQKIEGAVELHEGDIVSIGSELLRVTELFAPKPANSILLQELPPEAPPVVPVILKPLEQNPQPPPSPAAAPPEVDYSAILKNDRKNLFNKPGRTGTASSETQAEQQQSGKKPRSVFMSNRIFYTTLACAVIVGVVFFFKLNLEPARRTAVPSAVKNEPFVLNYTKEIVTPENIFRFSLAIENNKAIFMVDDLRTQLRFGPLEKEITPQELASLRANVTKTDFLNLERQSPGLFTGLDKEYRKIMVIDGRKFNEVEILNASSPRAFLDLEDALNAFAESCNMPTISLTPDELLKQARSSFLLAEDHFANYESDLKNLKSAMQEYNIVVNYLKDFSPEPEIRREAQAQLKKVTKLRDQWLANLKSEYVTLYNKKDYAGARNTLQIIMQLVDGDSRDYELAKRDLIRIDAVLRQSGKGGKKKK